ncbi:hypothetical protein M7775_19120 [Sporomusa sphaeroides DSM 2875]|uniref:hypothetical protein n=1 Tax=Sporomusa sphaeroides TaxID=47679 RepID=UPI00202EC827|nr:hypothetical protein [Sporomusa sphaeroides]MCM0760665.1 hypothetical protein [Sporomusa sphaeroides DSM 2875]
MKLSELFPERPTILFGDEEYTMEYTAFSEMLLENEYGSYENYRAKVTEMTQSLMDLRIDSLHQTDIINFLLAGLVHTNFLTQFINKDKYPWKVNVEAAKGFLSTVVYRREFTAYAACIVHAFCNSMISKEQQELLEILAAQTEKKTQQETEPNGTESTPILP